MKTFSKEEMLEILNKYLGYGNPDATIYFIGLEEKSPWTIQEVLPKDHPKGIQISIWLEQNAHLGIVEKIEWVNKQFGFDFEFEVQKLLDEYDRSEPIFSTDKSPENYNGQRTDCKQSDLSLEILKILKLMPKEEDNISYYENRFARSDGFEACLNYFPVARAEEKDSYDEEDYLFGTNDKVKFGNSKLEKIRKNCYKVLFDKLKGRMLKDDVFLILMGNEPYNGLKDIISDVFGFDFGLNENEGKLLGEADSYVANKHRNIWSIPHPTSRGKSYSYAKDVLLEEIKKTFDFRL